MTNAVCRRARSYGSPLVCSMSIRLSLAAAAARKMRLRSQGGWRYETRPLVDGRVAQRESTTLTS